MIKMLEHKVAAVGSVYAPWSQIYQQWYGKTEPSMFKTGIEFIDQDAYTKLDF